MSYVPDESRPAPDSVKIELGDPRYCQQPVRHDPHNFRYEYDRASGEHTIGSYWCDGEAWPEPATDQEAPAPEISDAMVDAVLDELGWPKNAAEVAAIASTDPDPSPPEFWAEQYRDAGRGVVATVYPLIKAAAAGDRMYAMAYGEVQAVLDAALGGDVDDGAGAGIAAEVQLLADQRDQARAALASCEAEVRRKSDQVLDARKAEVQALVKDAETQYQRDVDAGGLAGAEYALGHLNALRIVHGLLETGS
jgi:hypothetical protein